MSTSTDPRQTVFANSDGRIGVQASQYNVFGDNNIHLGNLLDAFERLPFATDAAFNSRETEHEPVCLDNTRVDLLSEIYQWGDGPGKQHIYWLSGLAGTGKSTIARTVAQRYHHQERLGGSFFFSQGGGDAGKADRFCTTIATQLAANVSGLKQHICEAAAQDVGISHLSLDEQWRKLVLGPLSKLSDDLQSLRCVIVIDALDECGDKRDIRMILRLLKEAREIRTVQLRIFLTSRDEREIRSEFARMSDMEHRDFVLHRIKPAIVDDDISIFLEHRLSRIGEDSYLDEGWPGEEKIRQLVRKSAGLFIWAATACRFVEEGPYAQEKLERLLEGSQASKSPGEELDKIYITVLENAAPPKHKEQDRKDFFTMLEHILGSVVVLFSPLSSHSLKRLLNLKQRLGQTLNDLHSILDIPREEKAGLLRLHHPSFRDFLLGKERSDASGFWIDERQAHLTVTKACVELLSASLKYDICGFKAPDTPVEQVRAANLEQYLPAEVGYACLYWVEHLKRSGSQLLDNDWIHHFLLAHFLHWIEALSWMRKLSEAVLAISCLETITSASAIACPQLHDFVHDGKRLILHGRRTIEHTPLQTYCSLLLFAPTRSIVKQHFRDKMSSWLKRPPTVLEQWSALLLTLIGHKSGVNSVAFSHDSKLLVSASNDHTIRLWDSTTGAALQVLAGHSDRVNSVTFSHNGELLASASDDKTVRLWVRDTGTVVRIFRNHTKEAILVAFSHDSKLLTSASLDYTVRISDLETFEVVSILESKMTPVAFSRDGKLLATSSGTGFVRIWNIEMGTRVMIQGSPHHRYCTSGFSQENKLIAQGSPDNTIKLWNVETGAEVRTLRGHKGFVVSVAFSHDSKLLASSSHDRTIKLWDIKEATDASPRTFSGHNSRVDSLVFSHNSRLLASASDSGSIKLWEVNTESKVPQRTKTAHGDSVISMAFSYDRRLLASASNDKTVRLWDVVTGAVVWTFKGHRFGVNLLVFSHNSKLLVSVLWDGSVKLCNLETGVVAWTFETNDSPVTSVAFSHDDKLLASALGDRTVKVQNVVTGAILWRLKGHESWVNAVVFSHDSKILASASWDESVRLWDPEKGTEIAVLRKNDYAGINHMCFSEDGQFLDTDKGRIHLGHHITPNPLQQQERQNGIDKLDGWIRWNAQNMLLLPVEYAECVWTVRGSLIALGRKDGEVVIMELDFQKLQETEDTMEL